MPLFFRSRMAALPKLSRLGTTRTSWDIRVPPTWQHRPFRSGCPLVGAGPGGPFSPSHGGPNHRFCPKTPGKPRKFFGPAVSSPVPSSRYRQAVRSRTRGPPPVFHSIPRPEELLNRELSWLDFNARVMEEAEDQTVH